MNTMRVTRIPQHWLSQPYQELETSEHGSVAEKNSYNVFVKKKKKKKNKWPTRLALIAVLLAWTDLDLSLLRLDGI